MPEGRLHHKTFGDVRYRFEDGKLVVAFPDVMKLYDEHGSPALDWLAKERKKLNDELVKHGKTAS